MTEQWRTAVYDGEVYEGLYKVSNLGRILSLNYRNTGKSELMTPRETKKGYLQVQFWKNGKYKTCKVHRLIAQTFLPNPENKPYINHKIEGEKGKKINMVIFNEDGSINKEKSTIEWVTPKENNDYGTHNERVSKAQINDPNKSKPVLQLSLTGDFIREWPSTKECGRNGFNRGAVSDCCRGKKNHNTKVSNGCMQRTIKNLNSKNSVVSHCGNNFIKIYFRKMESQNRLSLFICPHLSYPDC